MSLHATFVAVCAESSPCYNVAKVVCVEILHLDSH